MIIEYNKDVSFSTHEITDESTILEIPFQITFLTKISTLLNSINIELTPPDASFKYSIKFENGNINLPHRFEEKEDQKKSFILRIEFENGIKTKTDYELVIILLFEFNNQSLLKNTHSFSFSISENHKIEYLDLNDKHLWPRYTNMIQLALIYILFFFWNTSNNDILNQPFYTSRTLISALGTGILLFLGIEIRQLGRILIKKIALTLNFFENAEFYIEPRLLNLMNSKKALYLFAAGLLFSFYFIYQFTPLNLPLPDNRVFSIYYDTTEIKEKKVYRKDLNDLRIGLRKDIMTDEFKLIPLAKFEIDDQLKFNLKIHYLSFYYTNNCNFIGNDDYKDTIFIENIIKKPKSLLDSAILDRIKGKQNKIVFDSEKMTFCENKDGDYPPIRNKKQNFTFSPIGYRELIEDYHIENITIAKKIWDSTKNVSEFHLILEKEYCGNFILSNQNFMGTTKRPTESDIMQCYEDIVNKINSSDKTKPFYDDKPITTFDKLLQVILLFHFNEGRKDIKKICNDFEEYINKPKGKSKTAGFGGISDRILTLYPYLLVYLQKEQEENNDFSIFDNLDQIITKSIHTQSTLPPQKRSDEESLRHILIRNLFVEAAYFNLYLSPSIKEFFNKNKISLATDSDIKNKIMFLNGESTYNNFLIELQK